MANNFCKYLTNQQRFVYGKIQPCCWITRTADMSDPDEVKEYQEWLYSIDDWVPECGFCRNREEKNMHSPRLESFKRIPASAETGQMINLELQIDRDCNGACLICGPWNSTTWGKYTPELKNIGIDFYLENELDVKKYLRQIKAQVKFDQVSDILVLGGEPLRSDTHVEIINEIQKFKPLNLVNITYITNGSVKPSEDIINLWKKFKRVGIVFSIDAIGDHFNYLRWPLKWHQVENNLRYLVDLNIPTFDFTCSYTVTPFSILYHDTYVDWAKSFFNGTDVDGDGYFSKPNGANGTINLSAVPESLQQIIRTKYQTLVPNGHSVAKCLQPYDPNAYQTFMDYITKQDQQRNTNWRTVFPEIVPYFT
jgi:hypothetical protein